MKRQAAFSLVEVTLALGVAGFCLIAVVGLLSVGLASNKAAVDQTMAASLSSAIASDLRSTMKGGTSPIYGLALPPAGANTRQTLYFWEGTAAIGAAGTAATGANPAPRFRATVSLSTPATGRAATTGRIQITYPAMADPDPAADPARYSGALETYVALDNN